MNVSVSSALSCKDVEWVYKEELTSVAISSFCMAAWPNRKICSTKASLTSGVMVVTPALPTVLADFRAFLVGLISSSLSNSSPGATFDGEIGLKDGAFRFEAEVAGLTEGKARIASIFCTDAGGDELVLFDCVVSPVSCFILSMCFYCRVYMGLI